MNEHFEEMLRRLKLTKNQRKDAKTKYTGVAEYLHNQFYDTKYTGSTKLLIGSYGKKTNIRPPTDVDLLFKIPAEVFDQYYNHSGNGPSALLQDIRTKLGKKYTTTEKISAWGKVVLVKFSDGKHNVELLPAFDVGDVFMIPNSEDGGSWESFDARADLDAVNDANASTAGKARKLIKIIKRWRIQTPSLSIKSFDVEQACLNFLDTYDVSDKTWATIVHAFFDWFVTASDKDTTQIQTALNRAAKAVECEENEEFADACNEWRKVFGNRTFPAYDKNLAKVRQLMAVDTHEDEEFIEDLHPVRIDPAHQLSISATVSGKGFITRSVQEFINKYLKIPKHLSITFTVNGAPQGSQILWKIRNFGAAARAANDLRGKITEGGLTHNESSRYLGTHYAECYAILNGVCVARAMQFVPISEEEHES